MVNLKREISHAKLKCHEISPPPPPPLYCAVLTKMQMSAEFRFATHTHPWQSKVIHDRARVSLAHCAGCN